MSKEEENKIKALYAEASNRNAERIITELNEIKRDVSIITTDMAVVKERVIYSKENFEKMDDRIDGLEIKINIIEETIGRNGNRITSIEAGKEKKGLLGGIGSFLGSVIAIVFKIKG